MTYVASESVQRSPPQHSQANCAGRILTTGYATRPLRTSGPGRPNPTPAAAGVGTNLVLIDAVSGAPYGNQIEWATRATPGEAQ